MKQLSLVVMTLVLISCQHLEKSSEYTKTKPDVICQWGSSAFDLCQYDTQEAMITALMAEMTLDEKIGQMTQSIWHNNVSPEVIRDRTIGSIIHTQGPTPGPEAIDWINKFDDFQKHAMQTRLGIPLLVGVDAVHGQNTFEGAVIFPHNIGMGATRNTALINEAARITAIEAAGTGFNWTFSPCIAMPQHEHWGRVYEGFTEDLDFTTQATIASVRGHQGESLALPYTVAATAKHYILDGATDGGIEGGNAIMSEQRLRDDFLPPYIAAVDENVAAIMVGFNSFNGTNLHQHRYLVQDVLKNEIGFKGVVMTDWDGGIRYGEPHLVVNAGVDVFMQPGNHDLFMSKVKESVVDGTIPMTRIDDAVKRILELKFKLGLFKDPFGKKQFINKVGSDEHRAVARQAVRESLVLLKSDNNALPLTQDDSLAVVGAHGNNSGLQSGGWSINWQGTKQSYKGATTIFDAIKTVDVDAEYFENGCFAGMTADKVVVVVGEDPYAEGAGDTNELWLRDSHKQLINDCKLLDKTVITVMISGRALIINDDLDRSDAFIAAWLPGSEGMGVADFLYGIDGFKPTGTLPFAWPKDINDLPLEQFAPHALFPFGYGLDEY